VITGKVIQAFGAHQRTFSVPLLLGGSVKITNDVLLYRGFRHLKAPEEQNSADGRENKADRTFCCGPPH
jgi:hypothetical protein